MINQAALARLRDAKMRPEAIGTIFEHMAMCADQFGVVATEFKLDYQHPDDPVEPGELIPVIVLQLRPASVTNDRANTGVRPEPASE